MTIKKKNHKWTVNGNTYDKMTPAEKEVLNAYFVGLKKEEIYE